MILINADGISYSGTLLLEEVPATVLLFEMIPSTVVLSFCKTYSSMVVFLLKSNTSYIAIFFKVPP